MESRNASEYITTVGDVRVYVGSADLEATAASDEQLRDSITSFTSGLDLDESSPALAEEFGASASPEPSPHGATTKAEPPKPITLHTAAGDVVRNLWYRRPHSNETQHVVDADTWKYGLDVYLPSGPTASEPKPLVIHIHGGGWVRGDRSHVFYGAPGLSSAYAKMGFVAVAPSYRLGEFPHFLTDAASAIAWCIEHLQATLRSVGSPIDSTLCDPLRNGIILSGHSAGAHIVSTLTTSLQSLSCLDLDAGAKHLRQLLPRVLRGVVLVSGIYTLKNPFSSHPKNWRKCVFESMYMRKAFLPFGADLDALSPAFQLASLLDEGSELRKEIAGATGAVPAEAPNDGSAPTSCPLILAVPVVILSASMDLGLEFDSARFEQILGAAASALNLPKRVNRVVVPSTNHASICQKPKAHTALASAVSWLLAAE
jgi:hypothetical protein